MRYAYKIIVWCKNLLLPKAVSLGAKYKHMFVPTQVVVRNKKGLDALPPSPVKGSNLLRDKV